MNKLLLIFWFFILTNTLSAQECAYQEYYILVNSASKNYADKDYKSAAKNLKLAFNKSIFPLGKDLNLALSIALKSKDAEWAEEISIKLARGGVPVRFFEKLKGFKWFDKFKNDFTNYSDYYIANFAPEFKDDFLILIKNDKDFNNKYHEFRERKNEMTLEELIDGAKKVNYKFEQLIEKYGFPHEKLMGYNYVRGKNTVEHYNVGVLMIHIYQRGTLIFLDDLHNVVCSGGIDSLYEKDLEVIRGFGNSTGIEQEMKTRFNMYRK